jgi:hypothetical protein
MTIPTGRTGRRIGGATLSIDLRQNVILATPGGLQRVGPMVADLLEVLLRRYPDPVPFRRLVRELYPDQSDQPVDLLDAIRNIVKRARRALQPLGFSLRAVRPLYADEPSAYELIRLPQAPRGVMVVPPPKGLEL